LKIELEYKAAEDKKSEEIQMMQMKKEDNVPIK